jgi:hypothetical protein
LRYLGWEITTIRTHLPGGRFQSAYRLDKFTEWLTGRSGWIRKYEQERTKRNKERGS